MKPTPTADFWVYERNKTPSDVADIEAGYELLFPVGRSDLEHNRTQVRVVAEELERGESLSIDQRKKIAEVLRALADGKPDTALRLLKIKRERGQEKKLRNKWLAIDYWLRSEMGHSQVAATIAHEWQEKSVQTAKNIAQYYKQIAQVTISRWQTSEHSLDLYLKAVDAARLTILIGKVPRLVPGGMFMIESIDSPARQIWTPSTEK